MFLDTVPRSDYSFDFYQLDAHSFAIYPQEFKLTYVTLGLVGEAGEFADKVKKILRGDKTLQDQRESLLAEAGDVMWYLAEAATVLGVTLQEIAEANIRKLSSRKERSVIKGSGDER